MNTSESAIAKITAVNREKEGKVTTNGKNNLQKVLLCFELCWFALAAVVVFVVVDSRFCTAHKRSALEQTHCALVACDSKWVTVAYCAF